jgi:hypothetical protein
MDSVSIVLNCNVEVPETEAPALLYAVASQFTDRLMAYWGNIVA